MADSMTREILMALNKYGSNTGVPPIEWFVALIAQAQGVIT